MSVDKSKIQKIDSHPVNGMVNFGTVVGGGLGFFAGLVMIAPYWLPVSIELFPKFAHTALGGVGTSAGLIAAEVAVTIALALGAAWLMRGLLAGSRTAYLLKDRPEYKYTFVKGLGEGLGFGLVWRKLRTCSIEFVNPLQNCRNAQDAERPRDVPEPLRQATYRPGNFSKGDYLGSLEQSSSGNLSKGDYTSQSDGSRQDDAEYEQMAAGLNQSRSR